MTYSQHPLSAAFPAMPPEQYQELLDSVANIGVLNPITLFEGMVIDGWHRYSAAIELGVDCPTDNLADDVDPRDFVLGQNKARRHISAAQVALATAAVYEWAPVGNPAFSQSGTECPIARKTNSELASIAGTSERTIKQAKKVQRDAAPEVVEAVKRGEVGLAKASKIASLPKEEQAQALSRPAPKVDEAAPDYVEEDPVQILTAEVDRLNDRLAVAAMDASEEEKSLAGQTLDELRRRVAALEAELSAVKSSRDTLLTENGEMKRQIRFWRTKAEKAERAAA